MTGRASSIQTPKTNRVGALADLQRGVWGVQSVLVSFIGRNGGFRKSSIGVVNRSRFNFHFLGPLLSINPSYFKSLAIGVGWWLLNILNARHKDGARQIADVLQPSFHQHHSERSTASAVSLDSRTSCNGTCCPIRLELGSYLIIKVLISLVHISRTHIQGWREGKEKGCKEVRTGLRSCRMLVSCTPDPLID